LPIVPILEVTPETIEATDAADTYTVDVTANAEWTAESDANWCYILPDRADGNYAATIYVVANPNPEPRSALITITSGDLQKQITVNQAAARTLDIDLTYIEAPAAGDAYPITVTAGAEWTAESDANWCEVSPASGTGNDNVTVTILPNTDAASRTATVIFTSGALTRQVAVTQTALKIDAATIGPPESDGILAIITNTGGKDYYVLSINDTWWMVSNASKNVAANCTYSASSDSDYGRLYSWNCAERACPDGWTLPTELEFGGLSLWLTSHDAWGFWNSGASMGGSGSNGLFNNYGRNLFGCWWVSGSIENRFFRVNPGKTAGAFDTSDNTSSFSVRCVKKQ
jgi:hypothetical protein